MRLLIVAMNGKRNKKLILRYFSLCICSVMIILCTVKQGNL